MNSSTHIVHDDDKNFEEDGPDTIIHERLLALHSKFNRSSYYWAVSKVSRMLLVHISSIRSIRTVCFLKTWYSSKIFSCLTLGQNVLISPDQNVSILFVNSIYNGNITKIWYRKLYMQACYSSKSLRILSDSLGQKCANTPRPTCVDTFWPKYVNSFCEWYILGILEKFGSKNYTWKTW